MSHSKKKRVSSSVLTAVTMFALPFASIGAALASTSSSTLSVTTTSLPTGVVNQSYVATQLTASGGTGLSWSQEQVKDLDLTFHDQSGGAWDNNNGHNYDLPTKEGSVWSETPFEPGKTVTVHYQGTLASAAAVTMHVAFNLDFNNAQSITMSKSSNGYWTHDVTIPSNATEVTFYFDDGQGNWDSGIGGGNYNYWMGTTEPLTPGQPATITYDGTEAATTATPITMHWGFNNWERGLAFDNNMTKQADGSWAARVIVPGGLPAGMTLSPSGLLSGTPSTPGVYYFTVEVTDSAGDTANYTYKLVVEGQTLPQGTAGTAYPSTPLTVPSDSSGGTASSSSDTWSLASGSALPAGLTLGEDGTLTGTPASAGTYDFTVDATDSTTTVTEIPEEIVVNEAPTITTTDSSLTSATVGSNYTYSLQATGGTGTLAWSTDITKLPPGLTLSSAGVLSGTPTQSGTYAVPVTVTDANKATATTTLSLVVAAGALSVLPTSITAGYSDGTSLQISSSNANFQSGQVAVTLSNPINGDVTIPAGDISVVDATHLTVKLPSGDNGIGAGTWALHVTDQGSGSESTTFTVNPYTTLQTDVKWDGIYTNQSNSMYLSIPNPASGENVTVGFRAYSGNLTGATLVYWDTAKNSGGSVDMKPGRTFGAYQLWTATVPASNGGTVWYRIDMKSGSSNACLSGDGLHTNDTNNNNFPVPVAPLLLSQFEANAGDTITASQTNGDFTAGQETVVNFIDQNGTTVKTTSATNSGWGSTQFVVPQGLPDGLYTVQVNTLVKDANGVVNNEFDRSSMLNIGKITGWFGDLKHDSFNSFYRTPNGAVSTGTSVTLRLRGPKDLTGAELRVWGTNPSGSETDYKMAPVGMSDAQISALTGDDASKYSWWEATIPANAVGTAGDMWYQFAVDDENSPSPLPKQVWYDDNGSQNEGVGQIGLTSNGPSYQLSVYEQGFTTPDWMKHAVVYQIFPDRFFNGDITNDENPKTQTAVGTVNGQEQLVPIQFHANWSDEPYYPAISANPGDGNYTEELKYRGNGQWNMDFFGGDLKGIQDKLDYLQSLGVNTLYLTPIFQADSVHKYNTGDFKTVDPGFGTMQDYLNLVEDAKKMGMHIILDTAFEDTGSNSVYFNRFGTYNSVGAWQQYQNSAQQSPYYSWFNWTPSTNTSGQQVPYSSWWGYDTLPLTDTTNKSFQQFVYGGPNSVAQYWIQNGASGWRLDSADNSNFSMPWWSAFRQSVKSIDPSAVIIGEIWNNPTQDGGTDWLTGGTFDSVMNYQFRNAALDFFAGNYDDGNEVHNQVNAAGFNQELMKMYTEYPLQSMYTMLNLVDSHDTMRILTVLEGAKSPNDPSNTALDQATFQPTATELATGIAKLKLLSDFQYTFAGDPMVFAGDEAGVQGYKDPLNRVTYPWGHENQDLLNHYRLLGAIRNRYPALQTGAFTPLYTKGNVYAFARTITGGKDVFGQDATDGSAIVAMNNSSSDTTVSVSVSSVVADGTVLQDALDGKLVTVQNGCVQLTLGAYGAAILVTNTNTPLATLQTLNGHPVLAWEAVPEATGYQVLRKTADGTFVAYREGLQASQTQFDLSQLQGANPEELEVQAMTDSGVVTSNTVTLPALSLSAPTLQATKVGVNVKLSWNAVVGASSYDLYIQNTDSSWKLFKTIPRTDGEGRVVVVEQLPAGASTTFRVAAVNQDDYAVSQPATVQKG